MAWISFIQYKECHILLFDCQYSGITFEPIKLLNFHSNQGLFYHICNPCRPWEISKIRSQKLRLQIASFYLQFVLSIFGKCSNNYVLLAKHTQDWSEVMWSNESTFFSSCPQICDEFYHHVFVLSNSIIIILIILFIHVSQGLFIIQFPYVF